MKRYSNLKYKILELDNIALAAYKTFKGHRHSKEVLEFHNNFADNIEKLRNSLLDDTCETGHYRYFKIYDPKERLICAAQLQERILHHAIMNVCHDVFDAKQIYDSYASRKGKGIYKALERVRSQASKYRYFAKLDIRKYFDSIDHQILMQMLQKIIKDKWVLRMFERIINSYNTKAGKGLPIGNLTSQYFANHYLSGLDHHMKEMQMVKVYARYMDDVVILGNSRDEIKMHVTIYNDYAAEFLKLTVKPAVIGEIKHGIPFLGYRIFQYHLLLSGRSKRRFRHKILNYGRLFEENIIDESSYSKRITQLCAFTRHASCEDFRRKVIASLG